MSDPRDSTNSHGQAIRKCSKCKCKLLLEKFFEKNRQGEWKKMCEPCTAKRSVQRKKHRANNRERINAQKREHYQRNKEQILASNKRWAEANPEKVKAQHKAYYEKNREKILERAHEYHEENKEAIAIKDKERYQANREQKIAGVKRLNEANKEHRTAYKKKYSQDNKEKTNAYHRERRANDPQYRIAKNLRSRLNKVMNRGDKSATTMKLLGCTTEELKAKLEAKFDDDMTWGNYGKGWHIDHIRPCASFDLTDHEQQRICFHWSNLQPMWAYDNLAKHDTWQAKEDFDRVMAQLSTQQR